MNQPARHRESQAAKTSRDEIASIRMNQKGLLVFCVPRTGRVDQASDVAVRTAQHDLVFTVRTTQLTEQRLDGNSCCRIDVQPGAAQLWMFEGDRLSQTTQCRLLDANGSTGIHRYGALCHQVQTRR